MKNRDRVLRFFALGLVTMGPAACQQDREGVEGHGTQERDSAGIRIIDNASPPDGSRLDWRIAPEPSVSIGVREGEQPYMLHYAFSATKVPDGRIVVANMGSSELRVYDEFGTHLVNWGGRGEGPGEFAGDLARVKPWAGDSIIAWFVRFEEGMNVIDADGRFGRSLGLERARGFRAPVAVRGDGTILVVEILNGDGTLAASLGNFPSAETYESDRPEGGRGIRFVAYGFALEIGFWGDLAFIGPSNRYEIRALRADGTLARIVRRDHVPRFTTQADIDFFVESQLSFYPDFSPDEVDRARQTFESTPLAKTFPAFSKVRGDATGHLWVREYDFPGEPRPAPLWTVFDPGGRLLGFVETPKDYRDPGDRRGLHSGANRGRPRRRVDPRVAAGEVGRRVTLQPTPGCPVGASRPSRYS